jgi:hypothetical protein
MLKMQIFRLGITNEKKRLGTIIRAFALVSTVKNIFLCHVINWQFILRVTSLNIMKLLNDTFVINFLLINWRDLSNGLSNLNNCLIFPSLCIPKIQMITVKWDLTINLTMKCGCSNIPIKKQKKKLRWRRRRRPPNVSSFLPSSTSSLTSTS